MKQKKSKNNLIKIVAILLAVIMMLCQPFSSTYVFADSEGNTDIVVAQEAEEETTTEEATTAEEISTEEATTAEETTTEEATTAEETTTEEATTAEEATTEEATTAEETTTEEPSTEETTTAAEETTNKYENLLSESNLALVPDTRAESTIQMLNDQEKADNAGIWSVDIYYVNQLNKKYVELTDNFSLKYQIVFKSGVDLEAFAAEIKMPVALFDHADEESDGIVPVAGIPEGKYDEEKNEYTFSKSETTQFNYYIDEKTKEIVFFNYEAIETDTLNAWQVLYSNVDITEVDPDSEWSVVPDVKVTGTEDFYTQNKPDAIEGIVKVEIVQDDLSDLISIESLKLVPDTVAESTMELRKLSSSMLKAAAAEEKSWKFSIYYVNQSNMHNISKIDDFNMKYQFVFETDVDIDKNAVEIRIPRCLIYYGHGNETRTGVAPSDIGVPKGSYSPSTGQYTSTKSRKSPFNYYIDEETDELVFFNYEAIDAGKTAGIQVLYSSLDVMEIEDGYTWRVEPTVTAVVNGETQTLSDSEKETAYLAGSVNTSVSLQTTTKNALTTGKNYTPELYTVKQLSSYAPNVNSVTIPGTSDKLMDHFDEYVYMVWDVSVKGYATQPYNMTLAEATYHQNGNPTDAQQEGFIVGVYDVTNGGSRTLAEVQDEDEENNTSSYNAASYCKERNFDREYHIVTAYPKDVVTANSTLLHNNITSVMEPYDKVDDTQSYSGYANWTYREYNWKYGGDIIGVRKSGSPTNLYSWTTVYGLIDDDTDLTTSDFTVNGTCFSYALTHNISGSDIGKYIPGRSTKVTTVDDVVYAYPQDGSKAGQVYLLGPEDYYFNSVTVNIKDLGYDVFEDEYSSTEPVSNTGDIDRNVHVFAIFADSSEWEEVGTVSWESSGEMTYRFTSEQIAREPWRVKVEHNAVDYVTYSTISTNISIRGDSPKFAEFEDAESVTLENIGGIMGQYLADGQPYQFGNSDYNGYFQSQSTTNYDQYNDRYPTLLDLTTGLYNTILMRDSQLIHLLGERMYAHARKGGRASNDVVNSRAKVRYYMEAFEGYMVYSNEAIEYLREADVATPNRTEMVFYDLLPYGVQFDPSGKITGGRVKTTSYGSTINESSWDKNQVEVVMDPSVDVIQNYKNSGRTLLRFHVYYSGADSSVEGSGEWFTGFGIAFDAYCDYEDFESATEKPNVVAYMPGSTDSMPDIILGEKTEVSLDDGVVVSSDGYARYYAELGSDINNDGVTNTRNVLYAQSQVLTDIAGAFQGGIRKYARAEDDPFGVYKKSTTVLSGDNYEYKITVESGNSYLKNIVIFDRLENAIVDRQQEEPGTFDEADWKGTFKGLVLNELIEAGANPVVYYNANRGAAVPSGTDSPYTALTAENGWVKASEWTQDLSEVRAFAVDISADGFTIDPAQSISLKVNMTAPEKEDIPEGATTAYNNPIFYSTQISVEGSAEASSTTAGNSAKVIMVEAKKLEVEKLLGEDTPSGHENDSFRFYAQWSDGNDSYPYSYREYELYTKSYDQDGEVVWTQESGMYATDAEGSFYLSPGEKAVFTETDIDGVTISEEELLTWELEDPDLNGELKDGVRTIQAVNLYRPIIYIKKDVSGFSRVLAGSINLESFEMKLTRADGTAVADQQLYVVQSANTYGGEPVVIDAEHKFYGGLKNGTDNYEYSRTLQTDDNGVFTIYAGETIAIPLREAGETFTVTELASYYAEESDWICEEPADTDTLSESGTLLTITNQYRWKDLDITKTVTKNGYTDVSDIEFTFKLYEATGESASDKGAQIRDFQWQIVDSNSSDADPNGWLDPGSDGEITAACAGKVVRVSRFKAGTRVIVEEELAEELTDSFVADPSSVNVRIPVYATSGKAEIINEYQYRDLIVTKTVASRSGSTDLSGYSFRMILETKSGDAEYATAANQSYFLMSKDGARIYNYESGQTTVYDENLVDIPLATDANGAFTLKDGQKAVFAGLAKEGVSWRIKEAVDETYPPLVPQVSEDDSNYSEYVEGIIEELNNQADFINGNDGVFIIRKHWVGDDEAAQEYIDNYNNYSYNGPLTSQFVLNVGDKAQYLNCIYTSSNAYYYSYYWVYDSTTGTYVYMPRITFYGNDGYVILVDNSSNNTSSTNFIFEELDYTITEYSNNGANGLFKDDYGRYYMVNPGQGDIEISGTIGDNPVAEIENHLSSFDCVIQKRVTGEDVPAGSELVWKVEQYTNGQWVPAEGVGYCIDSVTYNSGETPITPVTGQTGSDGLISLVPANTFYAARSSSTLHSAAYVFFDRQVYVNHYQNVKEGDYRVSEVYALSDDEWGTLQTYITSEATPDIYYYYSPKYNPGYTTSVYATSNSATGFVNSTEKDKLRIEKVVDVASDQMFTFTLTRYTYWNSDDYLEPGQFLEYTIYDAETDEPVRSGVTSADGSFKMQGGQYAIIEAPPNGRWKVTEQTSPPYYLKAIMVNGTVVTESSNSAEISMIDVSPESNMIKSGEEFNTMVKKLLAKAGLNTTTPITNVYFGYTSDYSGVVSDVYQIMDTKELGTIRGYVKGNGDGSCSLYVLSDEPMYANYICSGMFSAYTYPYYYYLNNIVFDNFDTSKTVSMSYMFQRCNYLNGLDLGSWNTSSVTDMSYMFYDCSGLTSLDLSSWDTSSVQNMAYMFSGCNNLTSLNVGSWDTASVTNMWGMFNNCYRLTSLDVTNWNTSSVIDMIYMFYGCSGLTSLDLSSWDISNVTRMYYMFAYCNNLEHIFVGLGWTTQNATSHYGMFNSDSKLPHYNSSYTDKARAYAGGLGYLEYIGSLSVTSNNTNLGTVSGGYSGQSHGTIIATPADGANFIGWYHNGEFLSRSENYDCYCGSDQPYYEVEGRFTDEPAVKVNLKPGTSYGWQEATITNPVQEYYMYQSENYRSYPTYSVMKVTVSGRNSYTFYINSYAYSSYDYTIVSTLDATNYPQTSSSAYAYANTSDFQRNPGTFSTNYWRTVTFNLPDEGEHHFYIVFRNYSSYSYNNDRGYVLLPGPVIEE